MKTRVSGDAVSSATWSRTTQQGRPFARIRGRAYGSCKKALAIRSPEIQSERMKQTAERMIGVWRWVLLLFLPGSRARRWWTLILRSYDGTRGLPRPRKASSGSYPVRI